MHLSALECVCGWSVSSCLDICWVLFHWDINPAGQLLGQLLPLFFPFAPTQKFYIIIPVCQIAFGVILFPFILVSVLLFYSLFFKVNHSFFLLTSLCLCCSLFGVLWGLQLKSQSWHKFESAKCGCQLTFTHIQQQSEDTNNCGCVLQMSVAHKNTGLCCFNNYQIFHSVFFLFFTYSSLWHYDTWWETDWTLCFILIIREPICYQKLI